MEGSVGVDSTKGAGEYDTAIVFCEDSCSLASGMRDINELP